MRKYRDASHGRTGFRTGMGSRQHFRFFPPQFHFPFHYSLILTLLQLAPLTYSFPLLARFLSRFHRFSRAVKPILSSPLSWYATKISWIIPVCFKLTNFNMNDPNCEKIYQMNCLFSFLKWFLEISCLLKLIYHCLYYGAEGGVLELLETGAPYAPHVN